MRNLASPLFVLFLSVLAADALASEAPTSRRDRLTAGLAGGAEVFTDCALGSGFFFLSEGDVYVLTNEHVLRDARSGRCAGATLAVRTKSGSTFRVEAERVDREADLAVLKVFRNRAGVPRGIVPLVTDHRAPADNEPIFIVGSPNQGGLVAMDGQISRARSAAAGWMEMNLSVQPGQSGGPVISKRTGLVVGVVTARSQDVPGSEGVSSGKSYAVGPALVSRFLRSIDWQSLRAEGCSGLGPCPDEVRSSGAKADQPAKADIAKARRAVYMPMAVEPAINESLVRAVAIAPAIYALLVTVIVAWSRLPQFALFTLLAAYLLFLAGDWLQSQAAWASIAQFMPMTIAFLASWGLAILGTVVCAHVLLRAFLACFLFVGRISAIDSRGIRLKVGLLFRPWIASSLTLPILVGAWLVISYQAVWRAG